MRCCRVLLFIAIFMFARPLLADGRTISRAEIDHVVAQVIESFRQRSEKPIAGIRKLADPDESISFDEAIRRFRSIDISGWDTRVVWGPPGTATAHLTVHGTATRYSGSTVPFPLYWSVRIEDDGGKAELTAVGTDEALTAYQMLAPQTDEARRCLLESRPELDRAKILEFLADDLAEPLKPQLGEDAYVFMFDWARSHHDAELEISCTGLASTRALMQDDPLRAAALAEAGIDLSRRSGDADDVAMSQFTAGIAKWRAGLLDGALRDLRAAAEQVHSLERPTEALQSEYMYAYIEETRGNFRQAIESAERLRKGSHEVGWAHGEMLADWVIGDSEAALHNDDVARDYHRRVLVEGKRNGYELESEAAISDLAHDEVELGNFAAARSLLEESLRRMPKSHVGIATSAMLAHLLIRLGKYGEAEEVLKRSDSIPTPDESLRGQTALARSDVAFARGRFADAEKFARQAIARGWRPGDMQLYPSMWQAQTALARSLVAMGRLPEAELAYRDAVSSVEAELGAAPADDLTRLRFLEDKVTPYRGLAELLAARGRAAEALAVTEAIRSRALREIVEQGKIDLDAGLTPDERNQKQALEKRVTEATRASIGAAAGTPARRDLDEARRALEDFDAVVAARHGRAFESTVARREDIAGNYLRPDEIAVEYLVGDHQTLAFLVSRHDGRTLVHVRKLPFGGQHLHAIVERLSRSIRQRDLRWGMAGRAVYEAILHPLAPDLAAFRHICVIPDADLWSVPFDALKDDRGIALIEKATISYSPSLLMLRDTRRSHPSNEPRVLLAMANPTVNSGTTALVRSIDRDLPLGALPDAEREVRALRGIYGAAHADVHVGAAARESLFKAEAGRYRILHLATHGMVDDRSPMYSCLVLAPDAHDDGLLEMREIVGLDLHADLAVLSSCDTARGQIARGEGVVGIAWAFLAAGCPTTVVSQWKVDSAATERLMVDFHRNLIRGDFHGRADALRKAKLALMKDPRYAHPFYWAPFIVVGNP